MFCTWCFFNHKSPIANGYYTLSIAIVTNCTSRNSNEAKNNLRELEEDEKILIPWKDFQFALEDARETRFTKMFIEQIDNRDYDLFSSDILKKTPYCYVNRISKTDTESYVILIYSKEVEEEITSVLQDFKFTETKFSLRKGTPKEELDNIEKEQKHIQEHLSELEKESKKLANHLPDLKIIYDYLAWNRDKKIAKKKFFFTQASLSLSGWIPKEKIPHLQGKLEDEIKVCELMEMNPEEGEIPPVLIKNNSVLEPFESVTGVYGLPKYTEVDPTPYLSAFFIIFFGMCLSDAGYGLTLFFVTFLVLKLLNLPQGVKKMIRLLMYGGVFTFIFGVLYGGWFGLTPEQSPAFLLSSNGETFLGQILYPLMNPISILLLAMAFGMVHVIFGIAIDFYWKLKHGQKKEAFLGTGPWLYIMLIIVLNILVMANVLPSLLKTGFIYLLYIGLALLVLTQGRKQKNIFAKIGMGVLSLYGFVGYFSDVLSYSRLLGLGLSTGIIAFAVNIVANLANDLIPYVGWIIMLVILIGGHLFNLCISMLGAFIHSARLQFVEFFGKFMEGGGAAFRPLRKICKYVRVSPLEKKI